LGYVAGSALMEKLTSAPGMYGGYDSGGGNLIRKVSQDMLEDLHEIDTASVVDEPRVFNAIACKTRFGPKVEPFVTLASSMGSLTIHSPSVGSIAPRTPLVTPKNSQIDLLLAERNNFAELEDLQQVFALLS